jgi:hypothetical protein
MSRRALGWITVLAACLVVTSCTTTVAGQPRPAPESADHQPGVEPARAPKPKDRDPQAVTVALRTLDACGVIDLNAARAAGNPKASLLPMGPHACMLAPTGNYSPGDDGVEVSVGDGSTTFFSFNGKPVTIGGAKAYEYRDYHSSKRCELFFPVSFTRGIKFKYDAFDNVDTCQVLHGVAEASVAKLRNPDTLTVDMAKRPFAAWDGCFFLAQLLGPDAPNYTYQPDGIRDPFSGCKTTAKKKDGTSTTKVDLTMTPALEISYDKAPKAPSPSRQIAGKTAEVRSYSNGCALIWNQADSGTGNEWYGALMVKLTAATCDSAAQLAEKAVPLAGQAPNDAAAQPLRPLLYRPDENDTGAVGACVDFGADPSHTDCEPYHEVTVPQGTEAIMAAAAGNRNVQCAVFADAVKQLYGPTMSPVTWGAHCFFVEPTHTLELRVNVDPENEPSDYGKGTVYTDRRETQLASKPAVTFWDKDKNAFDIYLSPLGDLSRKGNVHINVQALHGRGDGSILTVKLDQAKTDTAVQVITQVTQKYFAG